MNLDVLQSMAGQSISIHELSELNKALRSSGALTKGSVGTVQQGAAFSSGTGSELAPLVPQSIQSTLDSATYTERAIVLWKMLQKVPVSSTLHESVVVNNYGDMNLDPFISEGGIGAVSEGDYERKVVNIKFLAEQREISDVATMVGIVGYSGVSRQGLAQQTIDGTRSLLGKLERSLFFSDESLSSLQFDGLYKQITKAVYADDDSRHELTVGDRTTTLGNYTDLRGAAITPQDLIEHVYKANAAPNFAMIDTILVEPRVYGALVNLATAWGRFQMNQAGKGMLIFGTEGLQLAGPAGMVFIHPCPLLLHPQAINSTKGGTSPTVATSETIAAAARSATELGFSAAEAGTYTYKAVAVNNDGYAVPGGAKTQAVTATQVAKLTLEYSNVALPPTYFRIYRAPKNETTPLQWMWNFPANDKGGGAGGAPLQTVCVDDNRHIPGTAPVFLLQMTPDVMYWAQLLDFLRRPLAQVKTTIPFLLMLFGSLHVKVPSKCWVIDNVSFTV